MRRANRPTDQFCTCRRYCGGGRWIARTTYNSREHKNQREYDRTHPEWWLHGDRYVPPRPGEDVSMEEPGEELMAVDEEENPQVRNRIFSQL
jgi:hypothetical protein